MIYKTIDEWIEHNPNHIGALPIEVCHQIWGTKGKGTIMTKDEALKLALKALEADELDMVDDGSGNMVFRKEQAITAIKEVLAQTQEPVAWGVFDDNLHDMFFAKEEAQEMVRLKGDGSTVKPLYTTPPQREFVGLTDEERQDIALEVPIDAVFITEAKLKEKNNV